MAYIEMMNAKTLTEKKLSILTDKQYILEHKIDGCRYEWNNGDFLSRLSKSKGDRIPHLITELRNTNYVLDGEIYYPGQTSGEVVSIMGALPEKAIARQTEQGWIRYIVYDVMYGPKGSLVHLPFIERRKYLDDLYAKNNWTYVDLSKVYQQGELPTDTLDNAFEYIKTNNLEGLMFKNVNCPYLVGKRLEGSWYKLKKNITYDVVLTALIPGKGKYSHTTGAIEFGLYDEGKLAVVGACSGMTDGLREELSSNDVGRVFEISAMERTASGSFRHPQFLHFRDDKKKEDCILWQEM